MRYEGRGNQVRTRKYRIMKKLILFLLMFFMVSCSVCRQYIPVESKVDSIYIERIVERIDTVSIEIPGE